MLKVLVWNKTLVFSLCERRVFWASCGQKKARPNSGKVITLELCSLQILVLLLVGALDFPRWANQPARKTRITLQLSHSLCRQTPCFLWMRHLKADSPFLQGFNPMWEETLVFTVHMPEIALIRFLVWDHDPIGRDFIGQRTIAFSSMMPGERKGTSRISGLGFCLWKMKINVSAAEISSQNKRLEFGPWVLCLSQLLTDTVMKTKSINSGLLGLDFEKKRVRLLSRVAKYCGLGRLPYRIFTPLVLFPLFLHTSFWKNSRVLLGFMTMSSSLTKNKKLPILMMGSRLNAIFWQLPLSIFSSVFFHIKPSCLCIFLSFQSKEKSLCLRLKKKK